MVKKWLVLVITNAFQWLKTHGYEEWLYLTVLEGMIMIHTSSTKTD